MNVSFDFDGTLHRDGKPIYATLALLRWHDQRGDYVLIVTTRTESHEQPAWWQLHEPHRVVVADFIARHCLPVQSVIYTAHERKAASLAHHRIDLHYDDDPVETAAAELIGIRAVLLNGVAINA